MTAWRLDRIEKMLYHEKKAFFTNTETGETLFAVFGDSVGESYIRDRGPFLIADKAKRGRKRK